MGESSRQILTKYVKDGLFDKHLQGKEPIEFKRSNACDNLIRNVMALDAALNSQDKVASIVRGDIKGEKLKNILGNNFAKMKKKLDAYQYWINRTDSLESKLLQGFDFEGSSFDDVLEIIPSGVDYDGSSPYALRAVRLLESIEEKGSYSEFSIEDQCEKAWALYRMDLVDEALDIAKHVVEINPACSRAWLLLAINSQRSMREARDSALKYQILAEYADPLSSGEQWAEDMHADVGFHIKRQLSLVKCHYGLRVTFAVYELPINGHKKSDIIRDLGAG